MGKGYESLVASFRPVLGLVGISPLGDHSNAPWRSVSAAASAAVGFRAEVARRTADIDLNRGAAGLGAGGHGETEKRVTHTVPLGAQ